MARRSLAKGFGVTDEGGCLPGRLLSLSKACSACSKPARRGEWWAKTFGVL